MRARDESNSARAPGTLHHPTGHHANLPLFPLPSVVLLPRIQVPLYIFEPRYRQMVESAIAGDRCIGMVAVPPEEATGMRGDPSVYPTGSVGRIERYQQREDGTFDILLNGLARFRILREIPRPPQQLYRSAEVEVLSDEAPADDHQRIELLRSETALRARELLDRIAPERASELVHESLANADAELYVNALSLSFDFEPYERQTLVDASSIVTRYEGVLSLLHFRLAELDACGSSDPTSLQ